MAKTTKTNTNAQVNADAIVTVKEDKAMGTNTTKTQAKAVDTIWVLTQKDKKTKEFTNTIIFDNDTVKAVNDGKASGKSFVSLQSLDRIEAFVNKDEVTKLFSTNLKALTARKVPGDYKVMFTKVLEAINTRKSDDTIVLKVEGEVKSA